MTTAEALLAAGVGFAVAVSLAALLLAMIALHVVIP